MANHPSGPDPGKKNRSLRDMLADNGPNRAVLRGKPVAKDDPWGDADEELTANLDQTSEQEHEEIMRRMRSQHGMIQQRVDRGEEEESELPSRGSAPDPDPPSEDAEKLLAENQELRNIIAELKQCLEETTAKSKADGSWEDREREYEALLDEKTEMIRELHVRVQELEKQLAEGGGGGGGETRSAGGGGAADQEELLALSDELERERCQIEQERQQVEADRRQLREDEDAMMRQMREMELQMAKERAELARQRNELQRLHSEIRHELELAQRDAAVNERLRLLQRRHNDVASGGGESDEPPSKKSGQTPAKPPPKKESGSKSIMQRFFGGGNK
jgi:hypothetical protein